MAAKRRRRARGRPAGGSEALVRAILDATLVALEVEGFVALRVDDIARAAGVNKTSIYRRWPTKVDLVRAALATARDDEAVPQVESGDLRKDLVVFLTAKAAGISTPRGRKLMRALMSFDDEVDPASSGLGEHRHARLRELLTRAIERGDLPRDSDPRFLTELLMAPVLQRVLILNEAADAAFIRRLVAHVLAGVSGL